MVKLYDGGAYLVNGKEIVPEAGEVDASVKIRIILCRRLRRNPVLR